MVALVYPVSAQTKQEPIIEFEGNKYIIHVEQLTWWADDSSGEMKVNVQFPATEPSLTKDGLLFMYQAYEVAPYAFGRPGVTVPYEKIMPYMTPEGRKLVENEK